MICLGTKVIDRIFLGSNELTEAHFGENQLEDFLPYLITDTNEIILDSEGTELIILIKSNISFIIN